MFAADSITEDQKDMTKLLMEVVSARCYWVESEKLLDVVTGVSGMLDLMKVHFVLLRYLTFSLGKPKLSKVPGQRTSSSWSNVSKKQVSI